MLPKFPFAGCFVTCLFLAATARAQMGFSAETVDLKRPGTPVSAKIYFAQERMRIEPQNMVPRDAPPIVYIVYLKTQTAFAILPRQRVYAEIPMGHVHDWLIYTAFLAGDVENACSSWEEFTHSRGGNCRKVGADVLHGRPTVKYDRRCSNNKPCQVWIDRSLHLLVKWDYGSYAQELQNIQEGDQPIALFEIPAGFTRTQATTGTVQSSKPH